MKEAIDILSIENILGYTFKDKDKLVRAFTHGSYVAQSGTKSYQAYEFLGDSIVDFVIAEYLLKKLPDATEGRLSKLRAEVVSELPLSTVIKKVGLSGFMLMGEGEKKGNVHEHPSVAADLFEAVTAAIFLDSGMKEAKKFVLKFLKPVVTDAITGKSELSDYKTMLNEYAAKHGVKIRYIETKREGPDHAPSFEFAVTVGETDAGFGKGASKKEAQKAAAENALLFLRSQKNHK